MRLTVCLICPGSLTHSDSARLCRCLLASFLLGAAASFLPVRIRDVTCASFHLGRCLLCLCSLGGKWIFFLLLFLVSSVRKVTCVLFCGFFFYCFWILFFPATSRFKKKKTLAAFPLQFFFSQNKSNISTITICRYFH